ncbi:MAG: hypothetical protein O7G85_04450 [Planctomycetota bacterium]|nr:hypothetical protein [Planctomycetota bacterium]
MIRNTITALALSAGLGGMIALGPAPTPEAGLVSATSSVDQDEAKKKALYKKYKAMQAKLEALKAAYHEAETSYEKDLIKAQGQEIKAQIEAMKKKAQWREQRSRAVSVADAPAADRRIEMVRAELVAAAKKAEALQEKGHLKEAQVIRERIQVAKKRIAQGRRVGADRRVEVDRKVVRETAVRRKLEALVHKARDLAQDGQSDEAKVIREHVRALRSDDAHVRSDARVDAEYRTRSEFEAMAAKAKALAADGQHERAQEIHKRIQEARKQYQGARSRWEDGEDRAPRAESRWVEREDRAPRAEGRWVEREDRAPRAESRWVEREDRAPRAEGRWVEREDRAPRAESRWVEREDRAPRAEGRWAEREVRAPRADRDVRRVREFEARRKVEQMIQKAKELQLHGRHDEAEEVHAEAKKLIEHAKRAFAEGERRGRVHRGDVAPPAAPRSRTRTGRADAPRVKRVPRPDAPRLRSAGPGRVHFGPPPHAPDAPDPRGVPHAAPLADSPEALHGRIEHMKKAAENLNAAGMHEHAKKLHLEAKKLMEQAQAAAPQRRTRGGSNDPRIANEVEALKAEMAELRAMVHHLMQRVKEYHGQRD